MTICFYAALELGWYHQLRSSCLPGWYSLQRHESWFGCLADCIYVLIVF